MKKLLFLMLTLISSSPFSFGDTEYMVRLRKQPQCSVQQMLDQAKAIGWKPVTRINPDNGGHGAMPPAYLSQIKIVVDNPVFDEAAYDTLDAALAPLFSSFSCIDFRGVQGPDEVRAGYPAGVDTTALKASLNSSGRYTNN